MSWTSKRAGNGSRRKLRAAQDVTIRPHAMLSSRWLQSFAYRGKANRDAVSVCHALRPMPIANVTLSQQVIKPSLTGTSGNPARGTAAP